MKQTVLDIVDIVFGFRKFIAFLILLAASIIFRINNLINGEQFTVLLKDSFLGFVAANGVEHFTTMAKDFLAAKDK